MGWWSKKRNHRGDKEISSGKGKDSNKMHTGKHTPGKDGEGPEEGGDQKDLSISCWRRRAIKVNRERRSRRYVCVYNTVF